MTKKNNDGNPAAKQRKKKSIQSVSGGSEKESWNNPMVQYRCMQKRAIKKGMNGPDYQSFRKKFFIKTKFNKPKEITYDEEGNPMASPPKRKRKKPKSKKKDNFDSQVDKDLQDEQKTTRKKGGRPKKNKDGEIVQGYDEEVRMRYHRPTEAQEQRLSASKMSENYQVLDYQNQFQYQDLEKPKSVVQPDSVLNNLLAKFPGMNPAQGVQQNFQGLQQNYGQARTVHKMVDLMPLQNDEIIEFENNSVSKIQNKQFLNNHAASLTTAESSSPLKAKMDQQYMAQPFGAQVQYYLPNNQISNVYDQQPPPAKAPKKRKSRSKKKGPEQQNGEDPNEAVRDKAKNESIMTLMDRSIQQVKDGMQNYSKFHQKDTTKQYQGFNSMLTDEDITFEDTISPQKIKVRHQ